jgi:cell division transport system permease protein
LYADYAHNDSIVKIEQGIFSEHKTLISDVKYRKDYLTQLNDNIENITLGLLVMCSLLLVIAIALINNTIRLSIYSKRFLIKSMQLVGATQGFIRRPFLFSGILQGLYGGALAVGLLGGLFYLSVNYIPDLFELQDAVTLGILFGGMGLMGILITWFSTLFSVQKYLRLKSDELY